MRFLSPILCTFLLSGAAFFGTPINPAEYPLRLHIFGRQEHTRYNHGVVEEAEGDGRGNLFENGEPHGVDFHYECSEKVQPSLGYETYMAKWRKPGKQLTVLFPVFGKSGKFFRCDLDTDVKQDEAYYRSGGQLNIEPVAQFKAWMVKHAYDPEHGKDMPTAPDAAK